MKGKSTREELDEARFACAKFLVVILFVHPGYRGCNHGLIEAGNGRRLVHSIEVAKEHGLVERAMRGEPARLRAGNVDATIEAVWIAHAGNVRPSPPPDA